VIQRIKWRSISPEETIRLGKMIAAAIKPRDVLALYGPLGAGKTQLVKGIAAGLGVPEDEPVVSPTFVLVREYSGRLRLYHVDAYRLRAADELTALGWEEMIDEPDAAVVLEWADRVEAALPPSIWRIELAHAGRRLRLIEITAPDPHRAASLAKSLAPGPRPPP
jgi:tRNA threonylcarbamoyladenosine biosynthesis protein TsaE